MPSLKEDLAKIIEEIYKEEDYRYALSIVEIEKNSKLLAGQIHSLVRESTKSITQYKMEARKPPFNSKAKKK